MRDETRCPIRAGREVLLGGLGRGPGGIGTGGGCGSGWVRDEGEERTTARLVLRGRKTRVDRIAERGEDDFRIGSPGLGRDEDRQLAEITVAGLGTGVAGAGTLLFVARGGPFGAAPAAACRGFGSFSGLNPAMDRYG